MDADNAPTRTPAPAQGGAVEPANRATVAKERFQTPHDSFGERYQLRDPFAEITHRADTFPEMVAKAEHLGSTRFFAVTEDGKRAPIQKVDGQWVRDGQRGPQRPASPERPLDPMAARDEVPEASSVVPMPGVAKTPAQAEQTDAKAIARIDAQAERAALVARLEAALQERYIIRRAPVTVGDVSIGRTEYRFRGDTSRVAFTESTFRLATDTNSPSVARSMVDVAEARNWKALRVSGNEDFTRMVWLEASVRGVKTLGYVPNPGDLELLKREREARLVNRIEPAREAGSGAAAAVTEKASGRGGGRKTVLAAIEAVLVAKRVPEKQRAAVMAAATEKLAQRMREGRAPKVKVYDKAAPQRPVIVPTPELQRSRDWAAPASVR
ncbi:MAG TPA: LPD7 domain-containing protein [Methylibium sp.]